MPFKCGPGLLVDHDVWAYSSAHLRASLTTLTLPTTPYVGPPLMIGTPASWRRSQGISGLHTADMSRSKKSRMH